MSKTKIAKNQSNDYTSERRTVATVNIEQSPSSLMVRPINKKHAKKFADLLKDRGFTSPLLKDHGGTSLVIPKVTPIAGRKEKYRVLTGNHYVEGAKIAKIDALEVDVVCGDESVLYKMAVGDNAQNGLAYTSAELQKIILALKNKCGMKSGEVARLVGCSEAEVSKVSSPDINDATQKMIGTLKDSLFVGSEKAREDALSSLVSFVGEIKKVLDPQHLGEDFVNGLADSLGLQCPLDDDDDSLTASLDDDYDYDESHEEAYDDSDGDEDDESEELDDEELEDGDYELEEDDLEEGDFEELDEGEEDF